MSKSKKNLVIKDSRLGKPFDYDMAEINHVMQLLEDVGNAAKTCSIDYRNTVLFSIEMMVRYQLERSFTKLKITHPHLKSILPATVNDLKMPCDFMLLSEYIDKDYYINDIKTVFLFDFLYGIVRWSVDLEFFHTADFTLFKKDLMILRMIIEDQLNGSIKSDDRVFKSFVYWLLDGNERMSAQQWLIKLQLKMKVINIDKDVPEDLYFSISQKKYLVKLIKKNNNNHVIQIIDDQTGKRVGRAKSFGTLKNNWSLYIKEFIRNKKFSLGLC